MSVASSLFYVTLTSDLMTGHQRDLLGKRPPLRRVLKALLRLRSLCVIIWSLPLRAALDNSSRLSRSNYPSYLPRGPLRTLLIQKMPAGVRKT